MARKRLLYDMGQLNDRLSHRVYSLREGVYASDRADLSAVLRSWGLS